MNRLFILLLILLGFSCKRNSNMSVVPKITYNSMQPKILKAGASTGGTTITLYFEDGDGDIGFGTDNLFLKESRDSLTTVMKIPTIPLEYANNKGLKGTITIDYLSALLLLRSDTAHINSDTLHWEIYLKDKAGNVSNTVTTEDLILLK